MSEERPPVVHFTPRADTDLWYDERAAKELEFTLYARLALENPGVPAWVKNAVVTMLEEREAAKGAKG